MNIQKFYHYCLLSGLLLTTSASLLGFCTSSNKRQPSNSGEENREYDPRPVACLPSGPMLYTSAGPAVGRISPGALERIAKLEAESEKVAHLKPSYSERADNVTNPLTKRLFTIMADKTTNLAVAADVTTKAALLDLADKVGPQICFLKTHIDIIKDFDQDLIAQLTALAHKHNFLIVEDRKFADIGSVVQEQYAGGIYNIVKWADIVISHAICGPDGIKALKETAEKYKSCGPRGALIIGQLSSKANLIDSDYTWKTSDIAEQYKNFVVGAIAQEPISYDPDLITCTPGISIAQSGDNLGQNYNPPESAIKDKNSDIIIVGRAIYQAQDPQAAAKKYRKLGWQAYLDRMAIQK